MYQAVVRAGSFSIWNRNDAYTFSAMNTKYETLL